MRGDATTIRPLLTTMQRMTSRTVFVSSLCALLLAGCSGEDRDFVEAIEVRELRLADLAVAAPRLSGDPLTVSSGESIDLGLEALDEDGNEVDFEVVDRRWSVADTSVGSIDGNGRFTAAEIDSGSTDVSLVIGGIRAEPLNVTVSDAELDTIEVVGPESPERCVGSEYYALGTFADTTERLLRDARFSAPDEARLRDAEDEAEGIVRLVPTQAGQLLLSVDARGQSQTRTLDVADTLRSIEISAPSAGFAVNDVRPLTATGTFTAADTELGTRELDITDTVDFDLPDTQFGSISNLDDGTRGTFTALGAGSVSVNARCGDVEAPSLSVVIADSAESASGGGTSGALEFSVGDDIVLFLSQPLGRVITVSDGDSDVTSDVDIISTDTSVVFVEEASGGTFVDPFTGQSTLGTGATSVTLVPIGEGVARVTARDDDNNFADLTVTVRP